MATVVTVGDPLSGEVWCPHPGRCGMSGSGAGDPALGPTKPFWGLRWGLGSLTVEAKRRRPSKDNPGLRGGLQAPDN